MLGLSTRANVSTTVLRLGLLGVLAGLPLAAPAEPSLSPFEARYEVKRGTVTVGEIRRRLQRADEGYRFSSSTRTTGIAALLKKQQTDEYSDFLQGDDGLRLLRYRYERRKGDKTRYRAVEVDWMAVEVHFDFEGRRATLPIPDDMTDPLLYQLTLGRDLALGTRVLRYRIADRGRFKDYRFVVLGEEDVETPAGRYQTVAVQREKDSGSDRSTFYLAPSLEHLAVRIDLVEDDALTQALLSSYRRCEEDTPQPCP
jgi:hypothetical protein